MMITIGIVPAFSQSARVATVEELSPDLRSIISAHWNAEVIADSLIWSEGPLWVESEKMLLFSDVPKNTIYKWTSAKGKEIYLSPSGYTGSKPRGGEPGSNGLLLDNKGRLVLCQHGNRKMALMDAPLNKPAAKFITLADNYQGKKFDSPNDAAYHRNGDLYFTDPPYGLENNVKDSSKAAPYQGVYTVGKEGKVVLLTDTLTRPNGIAIFPDGKTVLIANSDFRKPYWYAYDLKADGTFTNGRIFHSALQSGRGIPDGLKIDSKGTVFASGPGGIWILNKSGVLLGKIKINSAVSNCALSGDEKTLFVTADKRVLKIQLR